MRIASKHSRTRDRSLARAALATAAVAALGAAQADREHRAALADEAGLSQRLAAAPPVDPAEASIAAASAPDAVADDDASRQVFDAAAELRVRRLRSERADGPPRLQAVAVEGRLPQVLTFLARLATVAAAQDLNAIEVQRGAEAGTVAMTLTRESPAPRPRQSPPLTSEGNGCEAVWRRDPFAETEGAARPAVRLAGIARAGGRTLALLEEAGRPAQITPWREGREDGAR